jgi:hypothetical protein
LLLFTIASSLSALSIKYALGAFILNLKDEVLHCSPLDFAVEMGFEKKMKFYTVCDAF